MEIEEIIRQRLTGQGLCISVYILLYCAATEVERERRPPWKMRNALSMADTVIDYRI